MKRLLKYLHGLKKECICAPLFKMLEALFELLIPLVVASLINVGIIGGSRGYVIKCAALMIAFSLVGLSCSITAQYFAARAAVTFATRLRHALFEHIGKLSFSQMDELGSSTMITRMTSDINQAQSGLNMFLRLFLRSPFIVFGAAIMAFTVDVPAAMVFAVTIPAIAVVVVAVMIITVPLNKKVQGKLDNVMTRTRQNLSGIRVIRAFTREREEKEKYDESNDTLLRFQLISGRVSAALNPLTFIIINCATAWLIYKGAIRVSYGALTQGEVVALVNYMSQILVELVKLANLTVTLTKALACENRIADVLDIEPEMDTDSGIMPQTDRDRDPLVSFRDVSLNYHKSADPALSGIDLDIHPGEVFGIIGGTGSGKTSLAQLIPRFYDATGGQVLYKGTDVKKLNLKALRKDIGFALQKAVLFSGTIADNLRSARPDADEDDMWNALEIARAADFVREKEKGLDSLVEAEGRNFSGGQRQRLAVARAVVRNPEILILDDSFSALDYATDLAMRKALRAWKQDRTLIIISQRCSSVRDADRIAVMADGTLEAVGTHKELLETSPTYRSIYESQTKSGVKA